MLDHPISAQMGTKWVQNSRQLRQHKLVPSEQDRSSREKLPNAH
jgi:hypothetical protein